ncbi:MAG: hypothetical protein V1847_00480 [Candidatus Diapherotrites archaeon]
MGLYDEDSKPSFSFNWGKLIKPLAIVIAVIIVIALAYFGIQSFFQPKPIDVILMPSSNPWNPSIDQQAAIQIRVSNITESEALGYKLSVEPMARNVLQIIPPSYTRTDTLAVGDSRLESFSVKALDPNSRPVAGNYTISVSLQINGQSFDKEFVLQIVP